MRRSFSKHLILSLISISIISLGLIFAAGCSKKTSDGNKLKVAVTIEVEKGFVKAIAGDLVDVVTLVPKGGSPETYEATPIEVEKFKEADVFFAMELPVENGKNIPEKTGMKVVDLAESVRAVYKDRYFSPKSRDHHIWLSPKRVEVMVEKIAEVLIEMDPANKETYTKNRDEYLKELKALDVEIKGLLTGEKQRKFLIFHPALGYFADDYGLEMLAFEEEGKEANPKRIVELIDIARSENIKGILTTEEISSKQIEAFAEEINGKVIVVEVLSSDYIGAMKNIAQKIEGIL